MAESIVINRFNGKNHQIKLPCTDDVAATFAATILDGEYQVFKKGTVSGTEAETSYKEMQVMVKNTTTKEKTYLNMKVKASKTENDVFAAVLGLTINGITIDEAYVMSDRLITL